MSYQEERLAFPPLTPAIKHLLIANAVVFVLNAVVAGRLIDWLGFSGAGLADGFGLGVLRIVSYQFTHAFYDAWHFLFNMLFLYVFGTMAEARLGYRGTMKVYFIAGFAGAILHLVLAAILDGWQTTLVGASGACYGLMVYAATHRPKQQIIFLIVTIPIWILAAVLVFLGFYSTYVELVSDMRDSTSHAAHLGGAIAGFVICKQGWFIDYGGYSEGPGFVARLKARMRERQESARAQKSQAEEELLDQILEKVKEHGIGSLTPQERKFLEKKSEQTRRGG